MNAPIYQFADRYVEIDETKHVHFMAFAPGELAPVAILKLDVSEPAGYVASLWVEEAHRRHGLASSLLARAELRTKADGKESIGLSVHDKNETARRLYASKGYRKYLATHENYTQYVKPLT